MFLSAFVVVLHNSESLEHIGDIARDVVAPKTTTQKKTNGCLLLIPLVSRPVAQSTVITH